MSTYQPHDPAELPGSVPAPGPAYAVAPGPAYAAPGPAYGVAPSPTYAVATNPINGVALTAMIFGILGAVSGFWAIVPVAGYFCAAIGFPLALVAVICGHIGRFRAKRSGGTGRYQALTAVILGYASIAVMIIASIAWTVFLFVGAV